MIDINELIKRARRGEDVTGQLREKSISVRPWADLEKEYDPAKHPVTDKSIYPDIVIYDERPSESEFNPDGTPKMISVPTGEVEKVSRVTYALQELAVKRTSELVFGVPPKRVYKPKNDRQKEIASHLEALYQRNRIDSVNIERGRKLYASCEAFTLWYLVEQQTNIYGFNSKFKLRCAVYSPMQGDQLYPLFDDMGDMVAFSISYKRQVKDTTVQYFDTFTADTHLRWSSENDRGWGIEIDEKIKIGKIPGIYIWRPLPAWEHESELVYEMEWAMSRNGNYLRENSRPILAAYVSEELQFQQSPSPNRAFRDVVQYPAGSSLQYVTWPQAVDNLKFYNDELRRAFFTHLQLPDLSYENMKTSPMSGEARKQLFIDCQLKVKDESGRWLEALDREVNVVKAFYKIMNPSNASEVDDLEVENIITPFSISDEKDTIQNLMMKNGGKPLCSQRESIEQLGESSDVDQTLAEINSENMVNALGLAE